MIELTRSTHVFELNLIKQRLESADIESVILDEHTGGLMSGLGNIYPRLMVLEDDFTQAQKILSEIQKD